MNQIQMPVEKKCGRVTIALVVGDGDPVRYRFFREEEAVKAAS
jgi:hypothetical protein